MLQTNNSGQGPQHHLNYLDDDDDDNSIGKIDLDKLLPILNKSLGWIILFILFAAAAGHLYLRWTRPVFESNSILRLDIKQRVNEVLGTPMIDDDRDSKNKLAGEIELLKSSLVYNRIIEKLPLDISYYQFGKFLYTELYRTSPFKVQYEIKNPLIYDINIDLEIVNGQEYILKYKLGNDDVADRFRFGKTYENDFLKFRIDVTPFYSNEKDGSKYFFVINSIGAINRYLDGGLNAFVLKASANTIQISFKDYSPEKAQEIVRNIDTVYLQLTLQKKNQATDQTLGFLEKLLDDTQAKLNLSEKEVEAFIKKNKSRDVGLLIGKANTKIEELDLIRKQLNEDVNYLNKLIELALQNKEIGRVLPNIDKVNNAQLQSIATKLNELQLEMQTMINTTKETTTAGKIKMQKIDELRGSLIQLAELQKMQLRQDLLFVEAEKKDLESNLSSLPSAETELNRIQRFYNLNERFYMTLIEKQAEFGMAKAGTVPDFQILSPANLPTEPISPNRGSVYTLWIVIGTIAGAVLVLVRYILQDTVVTMKELEKRVAAPLLGIVPIYTKERLRVARMVVDKNPKSSLSESLRAIRTNIDFMSSGKDKKRVISVTSTVASEGKTFIAINLSGVLALSNQRVVLIDLDLRKPKLHFAFDSPNDKGMSTILIGKNTVEECINHTTIENIDVITAGPQPPNPSELLLRPVLDEVIAKLQTMYDIIVIDSPPVGLVTDGIILMQKADLPIYIVRSEYSKRVYLKNINKLVRVNGFKNLSVILNGLDKFKTYGYGYGYGYDYYTDDDVPQGFDVGWFKNLLGEKA